MHNFQHAIITALLTSLTAFSLLSAGEKISAPVQKQLADGNPLSVWIYFTDKQLNPDELEASVQKLASQIPQRTITRRSKVISGNPIGEWDIPVSEGYVDSVLAAGADLRVESRWLNAVSVTAEPAQIRELAELPFVSKIDLVHKGFRIAPTISPTPSDPADPPNELRNDYGPSFDQLDQINVIAAHEAGYTGEGVMVLMLDTGYYTDHESIPNDQIIEEWDFINNDGVTSNEEGDQDNQHNHGTATLSALGGQMDGELYGPAYNAWFLLAKTEDMSQEAPIEEDWYVAGLEWGEQLGAQVASSSLGYIDWYAFEDLDGETAVTTIAVNTAVGLGVVVVTAAGNYGDDGIIAPADAFQAVTCGAVDSEGEITSFSSVGPTADGRIKPEVCARGLYTHCASGSNPTEYRDAHGTSLSTPLVGGACALILEAHPDWTPANVRYALMSTADNSLDPNNEYGWGIIDVMAAISLNLELGDVNQDGDINVLDAVTLVNIVLGEITPGDHQFFVSDLNQDSQLDVLDVVQLVNIIIAD